jgi:hypothetical protein
MRERRDVEVQIEFLPTEHGGRRSAAHSGYRPQLYYGGNDWDAQHEYPDVESVRPGDHVRAYLICISPQFHDGKLVPGKAVLFREGQRVIAFGTITRVIDLPVSAYRARVVESLELYYRALLEAADAEATAQDRALCREHLEEMMPIRRNLRETTDVSDIRGFVMRQVGLRSRLSATNQAMADAFAALELAVADGPPPPGAG